ncbi:TPA: ClbS/DfsB family four-helix bundle protein [Candidatus Peregrinibacteria bacterium]|nr:ClbS/DfsB family four-helix bundle protein [Candidatus Peregrinibacteria bacterium]
MTFVVFFAKFFISATSSHYDWAIKLLKKYKKSLKK